MRFKAHLNTRRNSRAFINDRHVGSRLIGLASSNHLARSYVAKLLTIEASYQEISRIELANKILLNAISQKTKDYVGPDGN